MKLDRNGKFVTQWGTRGNGPGQFSGLHGIDADAKRRVYVADRGNQRIQVFDEKGAHLDTWPGPRASRITSSITPDQAVWVADGTNARLLKYDTSGKLQYFWGTYGTYPGAFWELHQFSVDTDGNFYGADSFNGRDAEVPPETWRGPGTPRRSRRPLAGRAATWP